MRCRFDMAIAKRVGGGDAMMEWWFFCVLKLVV
jgi:hypothetical protein